MWRLGERTNAAVTQRYTLQGSINDTHDAQLPMTRSASRLICPSCARWDSTGALTGLEALSHTRSIRLEISSCRPEKRHVKAMHEDR